MRTGFRKGRSDLIVTKSVHLNQSFREPHRTRGVQKLLSLDIFRYTYVFVTLNITGLIYELLLVFLKNRLLTSRDTGY